MTEPVKTDTPPDLLELADKCRRAGRASPSEAHYFYDLCQVAAAEGLIRFDRVSVVFRHLMYHAGAIRPSTDKRFHICPYCEAILTMEEGEDDSKLGT